MKEECSQPKGKPITGPLIFSRLDEGRFQLGTEVLNHLLSFIQDSPGKPEAGGILLGRHILDSQDIIVDLATQPLPGDRRTFLSFFRAKPSHQNIIDQVWRDSGGTCTYLGEWHTHPEQQPTPSNFDLENWQKKLKEDKYSAPIFFVIVGIKEIFVWEAQNKNLFIKLPNVTNL